MKRRLVRYKEKNENGREELMVAVELPWILSFMSFTQFGNYEYWERVGWSWYDSDSGARAHNSLQVILEELRDEVINET